MWIMASLSVAVDAASAMPNSNDFPGIGHNHIGIEMRLDALEGLHADLLM
jgi:hypothetical protein